eukprot:Plantae.Rhodophyta-Purpureofilum_apyrenoidigerum.ctg11593.p1 GENE.Plantae.Rhodophyta-Purpureofilum_apyrenoidigerum.ctg11593~~Plantae.Rhodophyta-Purpureofilum_apyrenoidigerum.ctg11593.p1  ORF type:complete len:414 (+),score=114.25 Plantae.Rhodophyta-Purpureofilum_apyrenoidigerum.ctg11593:100-1341(+)
MEVEEPMREEMDGMEGDEMMEEGLLTAECRAAANFLGRRSNDEKLLSRIEKAISAGDSMQTVTVVIRGFLAALNVEPSEGDDVELITVNLEGCMQVVLYFVKELGDMNAELVQEMAEGLCASTNHGDMRLRSLALLYNSTSEENKDLRFKLLMLLINLASKIGEVEKLQGLFANMDNYIKKFDLDINDTRALLRRVYNSLRAADLSEDAYKFNVKLLETYNGASDTELDSIVDNAIQAVVDAIKLPKLFRFDSLLDLSAVSRLKANGNEMLHELLEIFIKDELSVYQKFYESNQDFLKSHNLSNDQCVDKMRLLTFASLGSEKTELQYRAIANALAIPLEEVEIWVIRTISSGLVEAKMNQVTQTVTVNRSTVRYFTGDQWQPLSQRINLWSENIEEVLLILRNGRYNHDGPH